MPTAGVIQVAPLQYKVPDTLPGAEQLPPDTAVPAVAVDVTQTPPEHVNPAIVPVPVQACPTAG